MSRPLEPRRDSAAEEDRQRREVRARDKACMFEYRTADGRWRACGSKDAHDTAHVVRRGQLSPASRFHVDLAVLACRGCHVSYDQYDGNARVPYAMAKRAWLTAVALCKVAPSSRYNPDANPELYAEPVQKKREAA